jgi:hypothetical protein
MRRARVLVPVQTAALVLSSVPASAARSIVVDQDFARGSEALARAKGWTRPWRRVESAVDETRIRSVALLVTTLAELRADETNGGAR